MELLYLKNQKVDFELRLKEWVPTLPGSQQPGKKNVEF